MSCRIKLIVERLMLIKSNTTSSWNILYCYAYTACDLIRKEAEEQERGGVSADNDNKYSSRRDSGNKRTCSNNNIVKETFENNSPYYDSK
ncbi:MAG: hypothetical protein ACJ71J_07365 [Nitrososphaeraceae archaeon]